VTAAPGTHGPDGGSPWSWLVGAVWIVFLAFPIGLLLQLQPDTGPRVVGLTLIGLFAVLYVLGFVAISRFDEGWRGSPWVMAVLVALTLGVATLIGVHALGMVPFLTSYALWGLRWPRGAGVAGVLVGIGLACLVASGMQEDWFYGLLLVMVLGFSLMMRVLEKHGDRQAELNEVMAVVSERERVARDVHDVLGHSLTAIAIKAELAQRLLDVDPARARSELGQVQTLARDALADIRSTVSGLRATRIDEELATAQRSLTAAGIAAELPASSDDVEVAHRIVLAWAVREAVTNVLRHSGAQRCAIAVGPASLVVTDDGARPPGPEGNGLRGLRERVAASGGTVTFGPGVGGHGHELRVQL